MSYLDTVLVPAVEKPKSLNEAAAACDAYEEFLLTKKLPNNWEEILLWSEKYQERKRRLAEKIRRIQEASSGSQNISAVHDNGSELPFHTETTGN